MLPLLRAELFKMHKFWTVWWTWIIMFVFVAGTMTLLALVNSSEVNFAFPGSILVAGTAMQFLGLLLLISFYAQVVGSEYGYDTWKNLLVRHPGRVVFIASKWLALLITTAIGLVALILVVIVTGFILASTFHMTGHASSLSLGETLLFVLTQFLIAVVGGLFGMMGAVIGRSTTAGFVIGFVWFIFDISLMQLLPDSFKLISLNYTVRSLQALITRTATFFDVLPYLVVGVVYLTLPVVVAAYVFRQRDMLGAG